jgi:hypothetical protein
MATAIYTNIINQLQAILETAAKIKAVYPYPINRVSAYPAAIFFPVNLENSFESGQENLKLYRFKLYIVVNATQNNLKNIYSTILPNAVDEVLDALDRNWSMTAIGGHRAWLKVDSGDWTVSEVESGLEAVAEFNIDIKLLTNNS